MIERAEDRSRVMRAVKGKDTRPEMIARRLAHSLGYRYRLHRTDLPGKPDLVFPSRRKIIFVHGCFWHQHDCPRGARSPKSNQDYWLPKLRRNVQRDIDHQAQLQSQGWQILVLWECEIKDRDRLAKRLTGFLDRT